MGNEISHQQLCTSINFLSVYDRMSLGSGDCAILATVKAAGSDAFLTHDKSFWKVREIKIVDEILSKNHAFGGTSKKFAAPALFGFAAFTVIGSLIL